MVSRPAVLLALLVLGGGCASSGPVPMGKDTYLLAKSGGLFTISGGEVKAELYREANEFCLRQNKQLMPVNESSRDAAYYSNYANAEIQFRCLAEGDPQLQRPAMERTPDVTIDMRSR